MKFLLPDICVPNTYIHDLAYALEEQGHQVIWGSDNVFYSRWQPDVIAIQWPEYLKASHLVGGDSKALKVDHLQELKDKLNRARKKTIILSFVHNVKARPEGNKELDSKLEQLYYIVYEAAHGFIHLGNRSIEELKSNYPDRIYQGKPSLVISHGLNALLKKQYFQATEKLEKSNDFRIFVPGSIRFWSELKFTLQAFKQASIPNKKLVIAGGGGAINGKHPIKLLRRKLIQGIPNVYLFGHRLSDRELCREILAANILIAPRLSATNSGIPYLAATFGKPCLAPAIGNLPEAIEELNGILFNAEQSSSLAKGMEKAYKDYSCILPPNPPCPSWQEISRKIENFITSLQEKYLT